MSAYMHRRRAQARKRGYCQVCCKRKALPDSSRCGPCHALRPTAEDRRRDDAARVLAIAASGMGETIREIVAALGVHDPNVALLARRALVASLGHGNWRETRAEAAAKVSRGEIT